MMNKRAKSEFVIMDKIVLENGDGISDPSSDDPLWGMFRTYLLDIDIKSHRQWLNNQYKLGDVMIARKFVEVSNDQVATAFARSSSKYVGGKSRKCVTHIPTDPKWVAENRCEPWSTIT